MNCPICKKPYTKQNSPDGFNGYEILIVVPEAPNVTKKVECCKDCYLKLYKEKYPSEELPKI